MTVLLGSFIAARTAEAQSAVYIANANSTTVAEYQGGSITSGHTKPHRLLNDSNDIDGPSTVAFQGGNLWVTNFNVNTINEFSQATVQSLKQVHDPSAAVIISDDGSGVLNGPEGIVFDSSGNMWIGAEDGGRVLQYMPGQYATSGNPTPNIILNGASFDFDRPSHLAFDSAANLWVVNEILPNGQGGTGEIFRYNKSQIAGLSPGNQNVDPAFGIALPDFQELETIAFDGSGNLWVADQNANNVFQFPASELNETGLSQNLTPSVVLSAHNMPGACNTSLAGPYGLAVSNGSLFVTNSSIIGGCKGSLAVFPANKIASTGNPKPKVFITSNGRGTNINSPNAVTVGPPL